MTKKNYFVEVKFGNKWTATAHFTKQVDALHYIKQNSGERYPMRVIRVVRTIVFNGER